MNEIVPAGTAIEVMVLQPKPADVRCVRVTQIGIFDPAARIITDWVNGVMHNSTEGHYIEFWDRDEDGERGERHEAHVGDAIIQWPDGSYEVRRPSDVDQVFFRVGTEMYRGKS